MKVISCVGYHATGSGVIDDLFRECDNVAQGLYEAEVRFLHDPDGVNDLEYHLVTNPQRLGSGLAIKRFIQYSKNEGRQSHNIYGNQWFSLAKEYAESLSQISYQGWLQSDLLFVPSWKKKLVWIRKAINHFKPKKIKNPQWYDYYPDINTYYSRLTEDVFLKKTRDFVAKLNQLANPENKEFLMLDQHVSAHNPANETRYHEDIKVIIVDRDPRDLYIHNMYHKDHRLPKDPKDFAFHYKSIRQLVEPDDPNTVMRVYFEDMIYKYDEYVKKVFDFVGLNPQIHHIYPKTHFNPNISIKGTKMWKRFPEYAEAVKIIEDLIPEMLYVYPNE